ncbi:hypothetical protein WR25_26145 [Diploscapter pachys]|uniref:Cationic amino acid transporter C-terminal domain-containing protein n=1 Tax=Diploscapter pachys TaxID=2018661 RepID=A0A2A2J5R1_9BILA|nr:hypothetical protein WR25_26145 [Diploscapter pachys]
MPTLCERLLRKKRYDGGSHLVSPLKRCLSVWDVTLLAIGQMFGSGAYVLTGSVVRNNTGPSVVLSFLLAAFAALLSACSYAEFGARFPRAGSSYTYAYISMGELCAFLIGWSLPLEYMIGNAAVARSWTAYLDTLLDGRIHNFTVETIGNIPIDSAFLSKYPDILATILILLVAVVGMLSNKVSSSLNSIFVVFNISVVIFIIISGIRFADFSLWFDPHKTIPIATFISLGTVTLLYVFMSGVLTLMVPYNQVDPTAAYAVAFAQKGADITKVIISCGALVGMMNNLLAGTFALPRCVYAMAADGLLFSFLAKVNKTTKVPVIATIIFSAINALMALVFDIEALIEFLSIGTLSAYSFVTASVLILRYQPAPIDNDPARLDNGGELSRWVPFRNFWESLPAGGSMSIAIIILSIGFFGASISIVNGLNNPFLWAVLIFGAFLVIISFIFILGHNENSLELSYKVPFLPYLPCFSLGLNIFMMVSLSIYTWYRMIVWTMIGVIIYALYGIRHSKESHRGIADVVMRSNTSINKIRNINT